MDDIINNNNNNTDNDEYEKICYLCHRTESRTGKMITLPQNISICPDCMQKTFDTMNNGGLDDMMKYSGIPGIHFMNMSDFNEIPAKQKIKKNNHLKKFR